MADTKLSNTSGFDKLYRSVPQQIEGYTRDLHEDIDEIRRRNRYVSEVSPLGMVICAVLLLLGMTVVIGLGRGTDGLLALPFQVAGALVALIGFHGIARMVYGMLLNGSDKKIDKAGEQFRSQYTSNPSTPSAEELMRAIAAGEEREVDEDSPLAGKLEKTCENAGKFDKWTSLLVLVSRIAIPVILFGMTIYCIHGRIAVIPFILMFIFCRRICLLLEYKTGNWIRAAMCIPSLLYGLLTYLEMKEQYAGQYILAEELLAKIPEGAWIAFSTATVLAVLQTLCLILAVFLMDYYAERKALSEKLLRRNGKWVKKWGIYPRVTGYVLLMLLYFGAILAYGGRTQKSVFTMVLWCTAFGVAFRIISPIWPLPMGKVICNFWTTGYSLVVEAFFVITLASIVFHGGFIIQLSTLIAIGITVLASWITFAVMQHFWG